MKLARFSIFLVGFAIIGLAISLMSNVYRSEAAFGTSPPWVRNDHLLPGTTYEQIVKLSRNNPERPMQIKVRIDGDKEIKKWLTIENEKSLIMEKGQKVLPMKVIVKVPKRATLKYYRGGIFATLESIQDEERQGGTVAIKLGAHILVELTVTGDKVVDYRVKSIMLDDLTEGDFFYMNAEIENMGNTEVDELKGQVDIYDYKETEILHSLTFGKLGDVVEPDQIFKTQIVFPDLKLKKGEYWAVIKVFKGDEVLYDNRLYQKVNEAEIPVITAEDVEAKRPSLPSPEDETVLSPEAADSLKTAAPIIIQQEGSKFFLLFGIVGFVFGMFALVGIILFLIILLKRQQQATLQQYLTQERSQKMNSSLENKK